MKRLAFALQLIGILLLTIFSAEGISGQTRTPAVSSVLNAEENALDYHYLSETFLSDESRFTLKDVDYHFLPEFEIPGMPSTAEEDVAAGRLATIETIPQGVCIAKDYLLVTAYSEDKENPGCLYIFDRKSGEYLATLGMKKSSHLGGIAFDGENLWICHSDDDTIQRLPYIYLNAVGKCASKTLIDISEKIEAYPVQNAPSCIAYANGHLYVATTTLLWNSEMRSYSFEQGLLTEEITYHIPARVQGVAFAPDGSVILSTSYGRRNSSYLKYYTNLTDLSNAPNRPNVTIELPPCSEEIDLADDSLLVLFESGGSKYYAGTDGLGRATSPIDEILSISWDSVVTLVEK